MKFVRCGLLLSLASTLAFCQSAPRANQTSLPTQPRALAQRLYEQVVIHHPSGIPVGKDWVIFKPYMSTRLIHQISLFNACVADWDHKHNKDPRYPEKSPFGIFESGIFSGGDELTEPRTFQIGRAETQPDGTVRVYVTLKWWETEKPVDKYHVSAEKPYVWQVALVLKAESTRLLVDDVIFLKDKSNPGSNEYRLSEELSMNCIGPHFVELRDH